VRVLHSINNGDSIGLSTLAGVINMHCASVPETRIGYRASTERRLSSDRNGNSNILMSNCLSCWLRWNLDIHGDSIRIDLRSMCRYFYPSSTEPVFKPATTFVYCTLVLFVGYTVWFRICFTKSNCSTKDDSICIITRYIG
jgi:hypothetical protein